MYTEIQKYVEDGYLTVAEGTYIELDDFKQDWAQLGWYKLWPADVSAQTFVASAHFKWNSAYSAANVSGCGFAINLESDIQVFFLDRSKVFVVNYGYEWGRLSGTGRVKFSLPAEAEFTLIVNDNQIGYVLVDNELVGKYQIASRSGQSGKFGYSVLSGTNKDYGTHCEITNVRFWKIN